MDLRSIKTARKYLVTIGWLQMLDTPQPLRNRWGSYALVSLSWTRSTPEQTIDTGIPVSASALPPPSEFCTTGLPPLCKENREPFQEFQHQQPAQAVETARSTPPLPTAAITPHEKTGVKTQEVHTKKPPTLPPTLQHIVPDDLRDTARLLALFEQAHQQGLIGKSHSARLTFLATAEHACVIGASNPCGLFATLIRQQWWHYITDRDEDAASARLKQYWYGRASPGQPAPPHVTSEPSPLSKDAFMVRELHRELARAGFQGEAFGWVHRAYPEWTRARWDQAVAELATAQQSWQRVQVGPSLETCTPALDTAWAA